MYQKGHIYILTILKWNWIRVYLTNFFFGLNFLVLSSLLQNDIFIFIPCMSGPGIRTRDPCITRKVLYQNSGQFRQNIQANSYPWQNYHIPPLTKFLPFKKITTNTCSPFQVLIDLTNIWSKIVTASNETEMREIIKINKCLHIRKENVWTYQKYRYHFKK